MGLLSFLKRKKDPRQQLKNILEGYELPYFPKAAILALEAIRDPNTPTHEIARRLALDPGIHVRVLKTVNSAAFGLPRKVSNIEHAVALLGRARLEALILPLAVNQSLPRFKAPCLELTNFWLTAATRGSFARQVAQVLHPNSKVEAFSAGLLQDMAIPVILHLKEHLYCPTLETWNQDPEVDIVTLEKENFGFDHQEIGGLMAEEWELPEYLTQAISSHHSSSVEPAVYLASHLRYPAGEEKEKLETEIIVEEARDKYQLPPDMLLKMLQKARAEAQELAQVFL
ncbi:MAG TPA: HDOD domain-containing protein [Thermodesulfatator atlanticus]|uniref:HDOD domain-containing protein n=1 Tax=Thermodesulfatator atlanticus TaxID=501497 RepID=A0A7V5U2A3_9BACT|nr:HDOD domain-containing protein [Thermodesulfatator atlanticus]